MRRALLPLLLLPLWPAASLAGGPPSLPSAVAGWKRAGPARTIRGVKLFDYMNGAAEVHRMYGFRGLVVASYARQGKGGARATIKVERFDIGSAAGAFGDFTHARDLEGRPVAVGQDGHHQAGVLWFWQGRHLVCVSSRSAGVGLPALERLGKAVAAGLRRGKRPDLVGRLPRPGLRPRTVRYFRATAALKYHYGDFAHADRLGLGPKTAEATLADYRTKAGQSVLLIVRYATAALAAAAERRLGAAGVRPGVHGGGAKPRRWTALRRQGRKLRLVLEAPGRAEAARLAGEERSNGS